MWLCNRSYSIYCHVFAEIYLRLHNIPYLIRPNLTYKTSAGTASRQTTELHPAIWQVSSRNGVRIPSFREEIMHPDDNGLLSRIEAPCRMSSCQRGMDKQPLRSAQGTEERSMQPPSASNQATSSKRVAQEESVMPARKACGHI